MEAKVDVRKLQILNDRINQTIDALNQVRVSVHGLGHSGIQSQFGQFGSPFQGLGYGQPQGLGFQNPYSFGSQGGFQGIGGQLGQMSHLGTQQGFPGIGGGLGFQHSPFVPQYANPFLNPFTNPYTNPYTNPSLMTPWGVGQSQVPGTPWTGMGGVAGGLGGGLFHSNPDVIDRQLAEVRASDPYRISQTFPFVIP